MLKIWGRPWPPSPPGYAYVLCTPYISKCSYHLILSTNKAFEKSGWVLSVRCCHHQYFRCGDLFWTETRYFGACAVPAKVRSSQLAANCFLKRRQFLTTTNHSEGALCFTATRVRRSSVAMRESKVTIRHAYVLLLQVLFTYVLIPRQVIYGWARVILVLVLSGSR